MEALPDSGPQASALAPLRAPELAWLRVEQEKVVTNCQEKIQHWEKVDNDYNALQERLKTLPDKLSYNIMVPFGPFAFMPGKLVHTNEVTVLLGDNWFAKCSAKQAVGLVEHRKEHVRKTIDDLKKVMKNFESRVQFTEDLQKMSDAAGDIVDIREEVKSDSEFKVKHRIAHKPHSKPKPDLFEADFDSELLGDQENSHLNYPVKGSNSYHSNDDGDDSEEPDALGVDDNSVPTIYFCHTVEPKRVRINTGKNTTLEFSEKKEEAKRKRKNGRGGYSAHKLPTIKTPADIYRVFVDTVNGEYFPRKSILKSRSRENRVCSNTGESSAAEFDDRRGVLRSVSYEEAACSDSNKNALEEESQQETYQKKPLPLPGAPEAFSGIVIEKKILSSSTPHPAIAHPVLPTIAKRKEILSEGTENSTKRVSKFKAARLQQRN
ncbi:PREDICTED: unconventional prefoldin RPB5 interactor-like [Elephantulus edwardii]|uniref:unconventional prefoldin RPB5 interactor-like n=1 Tax=Elephantulus edwardii TaxID=28737 RepID=UPI0003F06FFC|nr:PREDICTED: unconventional prefoldin RPB5 interactor-like [Elephantulus edwardii]